MDITHMQIWGILILYCIIFAWMSVPFVTTDKELLRRQVMFIESLEQQIVADNGVAAANN